jgi:hypothetical protein
VTHAQVKHLRLPGHIAQDRQRMGSCRRHSC